MTGFRRRTVLLGLLTYAFGLIPFYFLTPVQPGVQDILRQTAMAATGAPTTGAAATTPTSSGSWFLYSAKGDLWETNVAQTLQLTHVGHYSQPALDGESLVYVEREKSYSDLWLLQPGAAPRRVTHNASADVASDHWVAQPTLLPGGGGVDVLSDQNKDTTGVGDLAVWRLDLANGALRQLTNPPPYTGGDQDVALDSREPGAIVFTRYSYAADGQLIEELAWLGANADQTVSLTTPDHPSRQASVAPDGTAIAFVQMDGRADNLYVGRLETAPQPQLVGTQRVVTGTIAGPVWSPDGSKLAYIALTGGQFQLWVLPIDRANDGTFTAGQPRQITSGDGIDAASRPVWLSSVTAADLASAFAATR